MDTPHTRPARGSCRAIMFAQLLAALVLAAGADRPARAQTADQVLAVVNGRGITAEEIDGSIVSQLHPLQQQTYALRKAALENLIVMAVLQNEAKRRGVPVEELRKQLGAGSVEVSPSQVEQTYLEHAATFASMSPDEAKERIRLDLETQARMKNYRTALAQLRRAAAVEIRLEEPRLPPLPGGEAAPSVGPREAPVAITEFADFRCAYCRAAHHTLKQIMRDYGSRIRLIFRHMPLDVNSEAMTAAQAAFCAGRQGFFWPYHDALFAAEDAAPAALRNMASGLKLDLKEFDACLGSEAARAAVLADLREAKRIGVSGTPTFVVNGRLIRGAIGVDEFKRIIEHELKAARGTSPAK